MGIFSFFIGPSQILRFPEKLILIIIGLTLSGCCLAPTLIPVLPELIDASKERFPNQNKRHANTSRINIIGGGAGDTTNLAHA